MIGRIIGIKRKKRREIKRCIFINPLVKSAIRCRIKRITNYYSAARAGRCERVRRRERPGPLQVNTVGHGGNINRHIRIRCPS